MNYLNNNYIWLLGCADIESFPKFFLFYRHGFYGFELFGSQSNYCLRNQKKLFLWYWPCQRFSIKMFDDGIFWGDSFGKYFGIECRPSPWWLKHRGRILDSLKHKYRIVVFCLSPQISHFTKPMLPNYQYFPQQHETVQYFK